MTQDPERLLRLHNQLDSQERELLDGLRHLKNDAGLIPPQGAKDAAWRGLATQLALGVGVGVGVAAAAPSAAAAKGGISAVISSVAGALTTKTAGVVVAACIAVSGYVAVKHSQAPSTQPAPQHVIKPAPHAVKAPPPLAAALPAGASAPALMPTAPALAPELEPNTDADEASQAPRHNAKHAVATVDPSERLRTESTLLSKARAELRAGHARAAQQTLTRLHSEVPDGALAQEREVLGIEALSARGETKAAERRARAFVRAHPSSPHAAKLARFLATP